MIMAEREHTDPTARSVVSMNLGRVMLKSPIRKKKISGNLLNKSVDITLDKWYSIRGLREGR